MIEFLFEFISSVVAPMPGICLSTMPWGILSMKSARFQKESPTSSLITSGGLPNSKLSKLVITVSWGMVLMPAPSPIYSTGASCKSP